MQFGKFEVNNLQAEITIKLICTKYASHENQTPIRAEFLPIALHIHNFFHNEVKREQEIIELKFKYFLQRCHVQCLRRDVSTQEGKNEPTFCLDPCSFDHPEWLVPFRAKKHSEEAEITSTLLEFYILH